MFQDHRTEPPCIGLGAQGMDEWPGPIVGHWSGLAQVVLAQISTSENGNLKKIELHRRQSEGKPRTPANKPIKS